MDKKKFGCYIKESRMKKNYTQKELADLLFVDVTTVSKWERGVSYPDITLVPDICRVLDVSEHELIASSGDVEYKRMRKDAKKYNNMKSCAFWTLNISYIVALVVCFIVNVSVSNTLSWFFIVLSSLICGYTFCPTITWMFSKFKILSFIISTFTSIFLLFFTCSIYTHNYWFMIATLGLLFGYFMILYPFFYKIQKKRLSEEERYNKFSNWFLLTYTLGALIITVLLLISIYLYVPYDLKLALLILGGCSVIPVIFGIFNLFDKTKSFNKIGLFSLLVIVVIFTIVAISRAIYLKSTEVTKTYLINQEYTDIKIEGKNLDINIFHSDDSENKIIYVENKKITVEFKVIDGILIVSQNDNRKFYDKLFDFSSFEINLFLSNEFIGNLDIDSSTGDVKIAKELTFNNVNLSLSTGDIEFDADVLNNLIIHNSTGDVNIENSNVSGDMNIENSTGDISLFGVNCNKLDVKISTGNTKLVNTIVKGDFNLIGSTGSVKFDGFDANNIYVKVSTGNVKGTLISSKIFMVKSHTGSINVPETIIGGVCKIETDTGNITITYK